MSAINGDGKELDLVLFGATGFTGKLVAEYLVTKAPKVRWALAGRSRDKLERVKADLAAVSPAARDLPIVIGDSLDPASVGAMVDRTRVVCTTVGPYLKYGAALVAACAERGVHYCDLTGETPFVRAMIDAHHDRAVKTGARIVCCSGFDSIPSDLGVFMVHDHLAKQGERLARARGRVLRASGGFSGGTVASIFGIAEGVSDPATRRLMFDPYGLDPEGGARGGDAGDQSGPRLGKDGRWTAPFIMAAINGRVVRRTNALLDYPYGHDFRYDEAFETGRGPAGLAKAVAISAGTLGFLGAAALPPTRALLEKVLPGPGEGPSRETRERGSFLIAVRALSAAGTSVTGFVEGHQDPGYGGTAKMLGEAALCLTEDALATKGGVTTPGAAMGMMLVDRLRGAGIDFRVS